MKELKITKVLEEAQADIVTAKIDGEIIAVIVDSIDNLEIIILSELGYPILKDFKAPGIKYYAPRAVMQGPEQKLIVSDQYTKFHINEKLEIIFRGPPGQEITFILRYK